MNEMNKKSMLKSTSLFNDTKKKNIIKNKKYLSFKNLSLMTKKKIESIEPSKKCSNIIEFIKQKNKFFIENSFDVKGTKEFLASKEVAMRAIKLNEEIIEDKKINNEDFIKNNNYLKSDIFENEKKQKCSKVTRKRTISPRKSRKRCKIISDKDIQFDEKLTCQKEIKKSNKKIKDNNIFDKNDSHEDNIYKFFIENANEPEDKFQKKLKKELKKVESIKKKVPKKEKTIPRKSLSKNDLKFKRPKRMNSVIMPKSRETQSIFLFSEINKKLMKDDDLNISSIDENNNNEYIPQKKKNEKRQFGSIQINKRQIKDKFINKVNENSKNEKKQKNKDNTLGEVEIESDKDSLISILSDLI